MSMVRFLHEMVREVAKLPLYVKILVSIGILINFIVINQWERPTLRQPAITAAPKMSISQQKPARRSFDFSEIPAPDETRAAEVEALLAKRMARITIGEPNVQSDGSISANGQSLHPYGIKPFNSKQLCKRASGEPWACGLHAYAMLRNTIAKKTIVCDPKTLLPNAGTATCRIGSTDIALMLVRDGLVELDRNIDDTDLVNAQASAKNRKLGIWDR